MDRAAPPAPTGKVEALEPLVRRVLAPNPGPFTFTGTQTYLVGDDRGLVVVDPGPAEPRHLAMLTAAIGHAPLLAILCTHTHRDHSPAAAPLRQATGAPIIGCAPLRPADVAAAELQAKAEAAFDFAYAPDRVLADGDEIGVGKWRLTALATPGHTSNHLCFALAADRDQSAPALFTGDHVMGWSTTVIVPPDGNMADYLASLERLHRRDDRIYYPAHGPAVTNPKQLVRGMIGHRRAREAEILRQLAGGAAAVPTLVARLYRGLDPSLTVAAGFTVLAHLIALEAAGRAARDGDLWRPA